MHKDFIWSGVWIQAVLASLVAAQEGVDPDLINEIFGSGLDTGRYGNLESGDKWRQIQVQQLPTDADDDCGKMVLPSEEPTMMELHEELKVIQVIKAAQDLKCEHYKDQGYECVPYYQCDEDGNIITDGYGLMDIRSGLSSLEPNFGILDSSDEMCSGSLDVCCKNADFTPSTGGGGGYNNGDNNNNQQGGGGYNNGDNNQQGGGGGGYNNGGNNQQGGGSGGDGYNSGEESSEEEDEEGRGNGGGGGGGYNPPDEGGNNDDNSSEENTEDGRDTEQVSNNGTCVPGKCEPLFKPKCGRRNHYGLGVRIQGFKEGESQFGEWPHMCMVLKLKEELDGYSKREVKEFGGGASLLSAGAVLTAAHKVADFVGNPGDLLVRCGEWDTQTNSEPLLHQDRKVKKIILHPEFNKRNLANTAAIIILESEFHLSEHVDTICLPDLDNPNFEDSGCHVKGWGKDKWEDGEYQVILKSVDMPMVDRSSCEADLKKTKLGRRFRLHSSFLCAGGQKGEDACKGDGGGPLVCPMTSNPNRYVQVGIVAWGISCGTGTPGVYTSVSELACWIDYVLKCNLGDAYQFRYNREECSAWEQKHLVGQSALYVCQSDHQLLWPARTVQPVVAGYGPGAGEEEDEDEASNQSVPVKIKVEKHRKAPEAPAYG